MRDECGFAGKDASLSFFDGIIGHASMHRYGTVS
jgi:hypothetical protein